MIARHHIYLGLFVSSVYLPLTKRPLERRDHIFVIRSIRVVSSDLQKEILFSVEEKGRLAVHVGKTSSKNTDKSKHTRPSSSHNEVKNFKRNRNDSGDVITKQTGATKRPTENTNLRVCTMPSSKSIAGKILKRICYEGHNDFGDVIAGNTSFSWSDCVSDKGITFHDGKKITVPKELKLKSTEVHPKTQDSKLN